MHFLSCFSAKWVKAVLLAPRFHKPTKQMLVGSSEPGGLDISDDQMFLLNVVQMNTDEMFSTLEIVLSKHLHCKRKRDVDQGV